MKRNLVIVESPAKCKKIAGFLGPSFQVLATMGHIRALEEDLEAVGLDRDFEPRFHFLKEKSRATKPILDAAADAETIYLAADDDREGEAIAYSVACLLRRDPASFPRAVFHEITAKAVRDAVANPRRIDMNRVMAQQARAVLDMMVGFTISPLLWKHVARGLSAGRCQTPALRLVWDREQAIQGHSSQTTWELSGTFSTGTSSALKFRMEDQLEDQESAMNYLENVHGSPEASVKEVEEKPWTLNAPKPLITSTLQQEASALHGMNPKSTMKIAQTLYEAGHITYMRTDHAILSEEAILAAQAWVRANHGEEYVGAAAAGQQAKTKKKAKGKAEAVGAAAAPQAQEAHEAIRPTHFEHQELEGDWSPQERKVYALIWRRAVQATMAPARGKVRTITLTLDEDEDQFPWQHQVRKTEFAGWQILGAATKLDEDEAQQGEASGATADSAAWKQTNSLTQGTKLSWDTLQAQPKRTRPQPRFNEATLIRELEQKGIGRPSTFASLVETLFDKNYVEKKDITGQTIQHTTLTVLPAQWPPTAKTVNQATGAEKQKLVPSALGESVLGFCLREFPQLFAYEFTAQMENRLDAVAKGEEAWKDVCRTTWNSYKEKYSTLMDKHSAPSSSEKLKDFGEGFKAVMSKTGPLLVQEGPTKDSKATFYSFPVGFTMQTITEEAARNHIAKLKENEVLGELEGRPIYKKKGPYGLYAQCDTLRVPITEGEDLAAVIAKFRARAETSSNTVRVGGYVFSVGQYGPYMYKDGLKTKNFVSIPKEIEPRTLTLAQAEELYKKCSDAKKAAASARGGFSGGRGRGGGRGGRGRGGKN